MIPIMQGLALNTFLSNIYPQESLWFFFLTVFMVYTVSFGLTLFSISDSYGLSLLLGWKDLNIEMMP